MKFKIGDKVKILPSATGVNVAKSEVGKIGVITEIYNRYNIYVDTDTRKFAPWVVYEHDIAHVIKKGQQLLFNFME